MFLFNGYSILWFRLVHRSKRNGQGSQLGVGLTARAELSLPDHDYALASNNWRIESHSILRIPLLLEFSQLLNAPSFMTIHILQPFVTMRIINIRT